MAYPAIPKPIARGYTLSPVDATVRTDMDVGAARVRRRTAARNDRVKVGWMFTDAQFALFRTWFDDPDEVDGGAAWFQLPLLVGNGGTTTMDARFVGPFQAQLQGAGVWSVTADLELRDA
jgi:hypothetical protein